MINSSGSQSKHSHVAFRMFLCVLVWRNILCHVCTAAWIHVFRCNSASPRWPVMGIRSDAHWPRCGHITMIYIALIQRVQAPNNTRTVYRIVEIASSDRKVIAILSAYVWLRRSSSFIRAKRARKAGGEHTVEWWLISGRRFRTCARKVRGWRLFSIHTIACSFSIRSSKCIWLHLIGSLNRMRTNVASFCWFNYCRA